MFKQDNNVCGFSGNLQWQPIKRNDEDFMEFLKQVTSILGQEEPPEPNPNCQWCDHREQSRITNY